MAKNLRIIPSSGSVYFIQDGVAEANALKMTLSDSSDNVKIQDELHSHPEVILEGIQTYLKYYCNITDSYEQLKNISRGKNITLPDIHLFIDNLNILEEHKIKLKNITPHNYIGYDNF